MGAMEKKYEFWIDKVAREVTEREKKLDRGIGVIRTESGIGASGIPHIGSMGDSVRAFGIKLGVENLGKKSEFIAFSDSRDGLRKVPTGLPNWLEKHIGQPVSDIPDPFDDSHKSYGDHMSSLLIDGLKKVGLKFTFISGAEVYKKGILDEQIHKILLNAQKVGGIVKKIIGQEKFIDALPYFPTCENCRKIYTTRCTELFPNEYKTSYVCDQEFIGENKNTGQKISVKGCGHKGEVSYLKGTGKLSWKVEFAARWAALKISFEAYGKDIADSVKVNDAICREILGFEPPLHIMYELFLQKGGRKISKSAGNVFTPQVWLDYGSPQSLLLLMFKRFTGTRELDVTDIPKYMDEINYLQKVYFRVEKIEDKRNLVNLTRLFEYMHLLNPPKKISIPVPYHVMSEIAKILPEKNQLEFAVAKLQDFGYVKDKISRKDKEEIKQKLVFAMRWNEDFLRMEPPEIKITDREKTAIKELIETIRDENSPEKLQESFFEIAKKFEIKPAHFFKIIYQILLKAERGPRLGPYIFEIGKVEVIKKLERVL